MKKVLIFASVLLSIFSCEEVVDIDTPAEPSRLFVDALIRIDTSQAMTTAVVNVGLTSSFFAEPQPAQLDQIIIENPDYVSSGNLDTNTIVLEQTSPGQYQGSKQTDFFTSGELQLRIAYNNQNYLGITRFVPAVPIDSLIQGDGELFSDDETEILVSFTDNIERDDFYLFDFGFSEYLVTEDEFYQGQTFEFSYFYDFNVTTGIELDIEIIGVDEQFYNYMDQLIEQSSGGQGPFQTPVATVRGNIINESEIDNVSDNNNFALGYFAVCQTFTDSITIEQ